MNKQQSEIARAAAIGFAAGAEAERQMLRYNEKVAAFHGLIQNLVPKAKTDNDAGKACAQVFIEEWKKFRDGYFT